MNSWADKKKQKQGPKAISVNFELEKKSSHGGHGANYTCTFRPDTVGPYRVDVYTFHGAVANTPFFVDVFEPKRAAISQRPDQLIVGNEHTLAS